MEILTKTNIWTQPTTIAYTTRPLVKITLGGVVMVTLGVFLFDKLNKLAKYH